MLAGKKPFASFHMGPGQELEDVLWKPQPFQRYVKTGEIVRYETSFGQNPDEFGRAILFALQGEEWRLKAYEQLYAHCLRYNFSVYAEPLFGSLYGYTDAQNLEFVRIDARLRGVEWNHLDAVSPTYP